MPRFTLIPRKSLRDKIFVFTAGLTALVIGVTIVLVNARFSKEISTNLSNSLFQTAKVLEHFRTSQFTALMDRGVELSHETRLKGSVATGDPETIHNILSDIQKIRNEDLILILSSDGKLVTYWGPSGIENKKYSDEPAVMDALNLFDSPDFWELGGQLFEIACVPITLGEQLVGILVLGNHIERRYMTAFVPMSSAQFAVLKTNRVIASTLESVPDGRQDVDLMAAIQGQQGTVLRDTAEFIVPVLRKTDLFDFKVNHEQFRGILVPIYGILGNDLGNFLIFDSVDRANEQLVQTRWLLILIGLGALTLALILNFFLSRSIMYPVEKLVQHARLVGSGDLTRPVVVQSNDEIGVLANAFDEMRVSLDKAQKELITNERMSLVGRMASSITHDFKQPMSIISLYNQMMTLGEQTKESLAEFYRVIDREINRMLGMINELLDFSRGEYSLNLQTIHVHQFIRECTESLKPVLAQAKVELKIDLGEDQPLYIDTDRMKRILDNLIRNAVDAMGNGGEILIGTTAREEDIIIEVSDTGMGIPEEIRSTIFEPFVTHGKAHGTGLGLAIAKKIVEEHHGDLSFRSETGTGTTFYIRIPNP